MMELLVIGIYGSLFIFVVYKLYFDKKLDKEYSGISNIEDVKLELANMLAEIDKKIGKEIFYTTEQLNYVESIVFTVLTVLNKHNIVPQAEAFSKLIRAILEPVDPNNDGEPMISEDEIIDFILYKKSA